MNMFKMLSEMIQNRMYRMKVKFNVSLGADVMRIHWDIE